jgi:hypothetical protein
MLSVDEMVSTSHSAGATAAPIVLAMPTPIGMLALDVLQRSAVAIESGPTGRSAYWPEWFAVIHPDLATTDLVYNHVDEVWMPTWPVSVKVFVDDPQRKPLAELVGSLREISGLPASDVAAMIGVKRRQLYNLLESGRASVERERWIGRLHAALTRLHEAAGGEQTRVRASLLTPMADGRTLFDVACQGDAPALGRAAETLVAELRSGRTPGRVQRPSPTLGRRSSAKAADEFLSGYRDTERRD